MKQCYHCQKYGVIDCVRNSRKGMEKLSKKQLLEVIDDLLNHHKGGLSWDDKDSNDRRY